MEQWNSQEDDEEKATTEDEILSLVDQDDNSEDDEESSLEEDEKRMIRGVFDLDNTSVREIMTPRVDVNALSMEDSVEDAVKLFIETGDSRIPVYEENVDNIKGILYAKDFLNSEKIKDKSLIELARRPIFIPETKEVGDLLQEIQKTRNHFSVVIDEYGGTAGIVTLEDIIEEIVGEIRDEYDADEDDAPMHVEMPDGSVVFDARTLIDDVNEVLDSDIPDDEDVDTIGGFICGEFGYIPLKGETLDLNDHDLKVTILQADNKKIIKIKIVKTNPS
jgi:CBS domain containing-hemolysin-like protein